MLSMRLFCILPLGSFSAVRVGGAGSVALWRLRGWRHAQLTTTGLPFSVRLELDGTTIVRLIA
jgi:hypothetical protein